MSRPIRACSPDGNRICKAGVALERGSLAFFPRPPEFHELSSGDVGTEREVAESKWTSMGDLNHRAGDIVLTRHKAQPNISVL